MNPTFKVGEIAIFQNARHFPHLNGQEVQILLGLDMHLTENPATGEVEPQLTYHVAFPDGEKANARPDQLRKKEPPTSNREIDTLVPWSDCAWSPHMTPA